MARALGLISGGLDSLLAAELLRRQGARVTGITFTSPFFGASRARRAAESLGLDLLVEDITDPHWALVKDPPRGYGKNMNPCLDCHALMLRKAGRRLGPGGFDFLFTGEVLGQRPFSQNRQSLWLVERDSGLAGRIVRPLSARRLDPTEPEKTGLVDRERLLDISGRGRKRQLALAEAWGITVFAAPAGGCLLTVPSFAVRLRDLLDVRPEAGPDEVELIKTGRYFRLPGGEIIIVGRHQADNERLWSLARPRDVLAEQPGPPGPTALVLGGGGESVRRVAAAMAVHFSRTDDRQPVPVLIRSPEGEQTLLVRGEEAEPYLDRLI
ncbi:MAG: tRNA 4-thiouridine(8) synthase ThiI [Proteobacteria bacterium]|nr:tRNA 4-thiouridine(8) synthase ThiI [Pseudomonadota bacterium]